MLDKEGLILASVMGGLIFVFAGFNYLVLVFVFLALSVMVTKYQYESKRALGLYEHERGWENVLSNGIVPTILAVFSGILGPGAYLGGLAAITADKFASEIGVLSGSPLFLLTLKPVKAGKSGSVSGLGFWMSLVGALLIGLAAMFFFPLSPMLVLYIGIIGFVGSIVDSFFGILEEQGIGNKSTTNLICSIAGALMGYFLISI